MHKLPVRPDLQSAQEQKGSVGSSESVPAINRSIPKPQVRQRTGSGNLRMRRSTISNQQPVVRSMESETPKELPTPIQTESTVNRSPSAASGGGGLDDLFGFGNSEGRMPIPRRSKKTSKTTEADAPLTPESKDPVSLTPETAKIEPKPPPPKPVNRSPSAANGGGLDDLFGFGISEGRMKIQEIWIVRVLRDRDLFLIAIQYVHRMSPKSLKRFDETEKND